MKNLIVIILLSILSLLLYENPQNRDLLKENFTAAKERVEKTFKAMKGIDKRYPRNLPESGTRAFWGLEPSLGQ